MNEQRLVSPQGKWERRFYAVVDGPWRLPLRLDVLVRAAFMAAGLAVWLVIGYAFVWVVAQVVVGIARGS